ncbi:hypothetical protein GCM10023191_063200 [Actinoallomurus oryzae]|uniref:Amino acid permease/ SLC12A domain-containing protein n=1 Tax=Actinoallomurus oryzae TaxID=502180 RepID=A0ABP8QN57_9ACTN
MGAGAATLALLAYNALQISTYGALGLYATQSFEKYTGLSLPWWAFALVGVALVAWLGFTGIHTSARVLGVLLVLEVTVLVVMAVCVLAKGGAGSTSFTSPGGVSVRRVAYRSVVWRPGSSGGVPAHRVAAQPVGWCADHRAATRSQMAPFRSPKLSTTCGRGLSRVHLAGASLTSPNRGGCHVSRRSDRLRRQRAGR